MGGLPCLSRLSLRHARLVELHREIVVISAEHADERCDILFIPESRSKKNADGHFDQRVLFTVPIHPQDNVPEKIFVR